MAGILGFSTLNYTLHAIWNPLASSEKNPSDEPLVESIEIIGNKHIGEDAIKNRITIKLDEPLDSEDASGTINSIMDLGHFSNVKIEKEYFRKRNKLQIFVTVKEKPLLSGYEFEGNSIITGKKLAEGVGLVRREAIDEADLRFMMSKIRRMYRKENYYGVKIRAILLPDQNDGGIKKAKVRFVIDEGRKTKVIRVDFEGCNFIPEYKVRNSIFTKEDWLGSFSDEAGRYDKDRLEADKRMIELLYQDNGYLTARVTDTKVEELDDGHAINVKFTIDEGQLFKIRYVTLPSDKEFPEHRFLKASLIKEGEVYSRKKVTDTITRFQYVFGEDGYVDADVYPQVVPDEKKRVVDITFHAEKGGKFYVNRINVTGNKSTRDWVIRRSITLEEGCLASRFAMDQSKENVEYLGYFERGSVEWKRHRIGPDKVDLELNVKEAATGSGNAGVSIGGTETTTKFSPNFFVDVKKRNFLGRGWDIGGNIKFGKLKFTEAMFEFFNPYVNDTNISMGLSAYYKKAEYEQITQRSDSYPLEERWGGVIRGGLAMPVFGSRVRVMGELGFEDVDYDEDRKNRLLERASDEYSPLFRSQFQDSKLLWLGATVEDDRRNHRFNPSKGWRWEAKTKLGLPSFNSERSLIKAEGNFSWHMPLMDSDRLVFSIYGKAGIMAALDSDKPIPYKELYHIGGVGTVRGFKWGAAGPQWVERNQAVGARRKQYALGAQKMVVFNTELATPIGGGGENAPRVYLFYDIGGGWNTPDSLINDTTYLWQNKFHLRHTIGMGLRMTMPYPVNISWGYKLDRNRQASETPLEMTLSMHMPM